MFGHQFIAQRAGRGQEVWGARRLSEIVSRSMALSSDSEVEVAADHRLPARQRVLLAMLSFLGGFTDTAGFLVLFGLFTAHVTGNIILAAADVAENGGVGARVKLLMLPVFVLAVVASTLAIDFVKARWAHRELTIMVALETILLGAFFVAALLLDPRRSTPDGVPVFVVGSLGVFAMGVQNTMMRELPLVATLPTTMMTGNMAQMTIAAVRWVRSLRSGDRSVRARSASHLRVYVPTLLAFLTGAGVAAGGILGIGYWILILPVAVAAGIVVMTLALDMGQPSPALATRRLQLHDEPGVHG